MDCAWTVHAKQHPCLLLCMMKNTLQASCLPCQTKHTAMFMHHICSASPHNVLNFTSIDCSTNTNLCLSWVDDSAAALDRNISQHIFEYPPQLYQQFSLVLLGHHILRWKPVEFQVFFSTSEKCQPETYPYLNIEETQWKPGCTNTPHNSNSSNDLWMCMCRTW